MATANVAAVYNGTVPYDLAVVACNLSTDISTKDFAIVNTTDNGLESNTLWTKVSPTLVRYTGGSATLNSGDSILIRRKTPNIVIQTVSYAARFSSDLWNMELDRIIRWREEADLNGVGALATGVDFTTSNEAFGITWDGDIGRPPSRNAVYDYVSTLAPSNSPNFTGSPIAPTQATGNATNLLATTSFVGTTLLAYAPTISPTFTGIPAAPTAAPGTNTAQLATTAFVTTADNLKAPNNSPTFTGIPAVPTPTPLSANTVIANTSYVDLAGTALKISPAFSGVPTAPTAAALTNTTQIATTAFVQAASAGNLALKADILSPTLTGIPAAPTAAALTSTTQIATTAFVTDAGNLKAPVNSPTFTGLPAAPTPTIGDASSRLATTSFVGTTLVAYATLATPTFSGTPLAPTAAPNTSTTQLATTAFVTTADNLKAPLASPTFTGSPAGPTPTIGNSTSLLATTSFVATTLLAYAPLASPPLTGVPTAPTGAINANTSQLANTNFVQQELVTVEAGNHALVKFSVDLYKNSVMNGRFQVWQRGFTYSYPSVGTFGDDKRVTADRWVFGSNNNTGTTHAFTVSRQEHTPGQTLVPNNPKYYYRFNLTALGAPGTQHYMRLHQNMEGVTFLQGKEVTLSFYARSSIASKVLGLRIIRNMGTGGSAAYEPVVQTFTLTSSFALYSVTFTFTSLAGATVGTEGTDNYFLGFLFGSGSAEFPASIASSVGTTDISDIQMEVGARVTRVNDKGFGLELLDCMRYYQQSYAYGLSPGTATNAGATHFEGSWSGGTGVFFRTTRLHTRMNKLPAITLYDTAGAAGFVFKGAAGKTGVVNTITDEAFYAGTSDATASPVLFYHWTATTES